MKTPPLNCYNCGAPAPSSNSPKCEHCGARLATVSCPSCFGMVFLGSKHCPHCGAAAVTWETLPSELNCPACQTAMRHGQLGETPLFECEQCSGLWLGNAAFDQVCRDAEKQALVLGDARFVVSDPVNDDPVRYRRCPCCHELMERVNFAHCSGVVVDVCRQHGTWFDRDELRRIVEFLRAGGLDRSRERQKRELESARRRLEASRAGGVYVAGEAGPGVADNVGMNLVGLAIGAVALLIRLLLRR